MSINHTDNNEESLMPHYPINFFLVVSSNALQAQPFYLSEQVVSGQS